MTDVILMRREGVLLMSKIFSDLSKLFTASAVLILATGALSGCTTPNRSVASQADGPCQKSVDGKPIQGGMFCRGSAAFEGHINRVH